MLSISEPAAPANFWSKRVIAPLVPYKPPFAEVVVAGVLEGPEPLEVVEAFGVLPSVPETPPRGASGIPLFVVDLAA